jgi:thiamine-phosphate pyrophosphorylase
MPLNLPRPILYAITDGTTRTPNDPDFATSDDLDFATSSPQFVSILRLIETAVIRKIPLFQIREKALSTLVLYDLVSRAVEITRGSSTRLLVNDRFDVALAAGADGVQLTAVSLPARVVREVCGAQFVIGVSTHSVAEARAARDGGADFVVFGPVFETESKRGFGPPQGLDELQRVTTELEDFPVLAIGGVTLDNADSCFAVGASGFAGISWFSTDNA